MPNNGEGEGTFEPQGGGIVIGGQVVLPELNYRLESWVEIGEYPDRLYSISTEDLPNVDFLVFEVWGDDPSDVQYITIYGPVDDWSDFEQILAYDFGEDGSLSGVVNFAA